MKKVWKGDSKLVNIREYTHLRGYHACRPTDVGSYLKSGIQIFGHDDMQQRAVSIFGKELSEIKNLENERDISPSNEIYFCVNKTELLNDSGHYLCWGSEYLAGLAALLDRSERGSFHTKLEETGIPTVFVCDVPIELISQQCLESIVEYFNPANNNCAFWIYEPLPASCIVGHEHPKRIFNPVKNSTYMNHKLKCPYC